MTEIYLLRFEIPILILVTRSRYLSQRDEESFAKVFRAFGVLERVNYGTFSDLAEKSINAKGNIRSMTDSVVIQRSGKPALPPAAPRQKILLIDEVDVFFSDTFYGSTYTPTSVFRNEHTDALQQYLWAQRVVIADLGAGKLIELAKQQPSFLALKERYDHLGKVLDFHLRSMVSSLEKIPGVKSAAGELTDVFGSGGYHVVQGVLAEEELGAAAADVAEESLEPEPEQADGGEAGSPLLPHSEQPTGWRVAYQDQAVLSDKIFVDYETMWLYFYEQGLYNEDEGSMHGTLNPKAIDGPMDVDHALGVRLKCGEFSFAEMGRAPYYKHTLGVTGTLDCLGDFELGIIRDDYGIRRMSLAPSIYGANRMVFDRPGRDDPNASLEIVPDLEGWHQAIQNEIVLRQRLKVPVVVFFETEARMKAYDEWLEARNISKPNQEMVTEEEDNIDFYVRFAARSGNATLFTKFHGRGTDFKVREDSVDAAGGMHVLQTFLSEEKAEEIQIRGRSARQDKRGTYKLVLLAQDLEKFELPAGGLRTYALLDEKRRAYTEKGTAERREKVRRRSAPFFGSRFD
jgi:hypothetical protein